MRQYIYADETGNFDFSNGTDASRYFILASVTVVDHAMETDLLDLRRELALEGVHLPKGLHATNDKQRVRNRVFGILAQHDFRVDATIIEKRKAIPSLHTTDARFYGFAWAAHLAGLIPELATSATEVLLTAASIGTGDMRSAFEREIDIAVRQLHPNTVVKGDMVGAQTSPMLQAADYCAWALMRKWERNDTRSYVSISAKIASEYDFFGQSESA